MRDPAGTPPSYDEVCGSGSAVAPLVAPDPLAAGDEAMVTLAAQRTLPDGAWAKAEPGSLLVVATRMESTT